MTGNQAHHAGTSGWIAMPRWLRVLMQSIFVSYVGVSAALTVLFVYTLIQLAVKPAHTGPGQMGASLQAWLIGFDTAAIVLMQCVAAASVHCLAAESQQWPEILRQYQESTLSQCAFSALSVLGGIFVVAWVATADRDASWLLRLGATLFAWWLFRSAWVHTQVVWKRFAPLRGRSASGPEVEWIP